MTPRHSPRLLRSLRLLCALAPLAALFDPASVRPAEGCSGGSSYSKHGWESPSLLTPGQLPTNAAAAFEASYYQYTLPTDLSPGVSVALKGPDGQQVTGSLVFDKISEPILQGDLPGTGHKVRFAFVPDAPLSPSTTYDGHLLVASMNAAGGKSIDLPFSLTTSGEPGALVKPVEAKSKLLQKLSLTGEADRSCSYTAGGDCGKPSFPGKEELTPYVEISWSTGLTPAEDALLTLSVVPLDASGAELPAVVVRRVGEATQVRYEKAEKYCFKTTTTTLAKAEPVTGEVVCVPHVDPVETLPGSPLEPILEGCFVPPYVPMSGHVDSELLGRWCALHPDLRESNPPGQWTCPEGSGDGETPASAQPEESSCSASAVRPAVSGFSVSLLGLAALFGLSRRRRRRPG